MLHMIDIINMSDMSDITNMHSIIIEFQPNRMLASLPPRWKLYYKQKANYILIKCM